MRITNCRMRKWGTRKAILLSNIKMVMFLMGSNPAISTTDMDHIISMVEENIKGIGSIISSLDKASYIHRMALYTLDNSKRESGMAEA